MALFSNRRAAGRHLIDPVAKRVFGPGVVLALSGSSVPVGYEVALGLGVLLDVLLTRHLVVPGHDEVAFGFVSTAGHHFMDADVIANLRLDPAVAQATRADQQRELEALESQYRSGRTAVNWSGRTAILIDDFAATGARLQAAVDAARKSAPERVILALPAATRRVCQAAQHWADDVVCLYSVDPPIQLNDVYEQPQEPPQSEVTALLRRNAHFAPRPSSYRQPRYPGAPVSSQRRP